MMGTMDVMPLSTSEVEVMAVVPASRLVSFERVRAGLGVKEVSLATEQEFASMFSGCEIGAMPPFGNLFGLPVYVDPALQKDEAIFFNAGNHLQTVRLKYTDFEELIKPRVVPLSDGGGRKEKAA